MSKILDGKKTSQRIKEEIKIEVGKLITDGYRPPHLAAILVGEDGASLTYVTNKVLSCKQVGFKSSLKAGTWEETKSAEPLAESEDRLGDRVMDEGILALFLQLLHLRFDQRIGGNRERESDYAQDLQCVSR